MSWQSLFDRGDAVEVDLETIQSRLESQRSRADSSKASNDDDDFTETETESQPESNGSGTERSDQPNPARVVADADVLAADVLVGDAAREALDHVRRHSWVDLAASDELLAETERLVATLADEELATAYRTRLESERVAVDHPIGDHSALASAYRASAAHLLSYDKRLGSAKAGLTLQPHVSLSVRPPDAFARLFDPESLYAAVTDGEEYPGPDRDPRE